METPASISGHPIHPMLVAVPIGLWVFSLVCDFVFLTGLGDVVWNEVAFYTMAGGIAGALIAAVPGLIDFLSLEDPKAKKIGATHMTINLGVVAIYAVNLWLRHASPPEARLPVVLSVVTVLLLVVSGWLGGELIFKHGVGRAARPAPHGPGQLPS